MRPEPQPSRYIPDPQIGAIADWIGDPVEPAQFPKALQRFRNHRWDKAIGLHGLSDAQWVQHFGEFVPLEGNITHPLALRYHGHQFRVYNPQIGDGRGFLLAQMRDGYGRLLDCGTKGSGQTPWSRDGDGRLTLKGAVREILATEMLEAQGVYTSKTLSVIETGEELWRSDEPSPARSAVLTRLSHGHIRIGSFQRLAALEEHELLEKLVDYCLVTYPGPPPPDEAIARDEPSVQLMHQVVERLADLAASYMVAGFVHGVLNSDNMNITGESFDYGPWRWLPTWEGNFTAAYFDQNGLYSFGRQPEAIHWNCAQLAQSLLPLAEQQPLVDALQRFPDLYHANLARRLCWRLGVNSQGQDRDMELFLACGETMRDTGTNPERFYFKHRGGQRAQGRLEQAFSGYDGYDPEECKDHPYWQRETPITMLIDEVEAIWTAIAERDDWTALAKKITDIRLFGDALGQPRPPAGHRAAA